MKYWYNENTGAFMFSGKIKELKSFLNMLESIYGCDMSFSECMTKFSNRKNKVIAEVMM